MSKEVEDLTTIFTTIGENFTLIADRMLELQNVVVDLHQKVAHLEAMLDDDLK